jgi:phosphomannomutase
MSIFKAYDIRGTFGSDFDANTVYRIGRCLPGLLHARRMLIGRDARHSSPAVREALCRGLTEAGADVDDLGLATTPMVYYFTALDGYDASVQITASHNPPADNGMKISTTGARPVGLDTGLAELERRVLASALPPPAPQPGRVRPVSRLAEFVAFLKPWIPDLSGLRLAIDCSDGMTSLLAHDLFGPGAIYLNDTPDGAFPHHAPNPLDVANCAQLMAVVRREHLDAGVIFDGDGDRVMFVDETGLFIQPDYLIPIVARPFLRREPGAIVLHDIRTSRGVIEVLQAEGARTEMGRVGHAYAKEKMRLTGAACGGELAGHYYFRDFYCCDSGELAALVVLRELADAQRRGQRFSDLLAPIRRYATTGELNFTLRDKDAALAALRAAFEARAKPLAVHDFDGVRLEFAEGWISVRKSNTEPYLRVIIETVDEKTLVAWRAVAEAVLCGPAENQRR